MRWFYKALGRKATALKICGLCEHQLPIIFPLFPKLTHLTLDNMSLKGRRRIAAFPRLQSLKLNRVSSYTQYLTELFHHLDHSLRVLDFGEDMPKGINALHNLHEVHLCNQALTKDIANFWRQNAQIKRLYIGETDHWDDPHHGHYMGRFWHMMDTKWKKQCVITNYQA